MSFFVMDYIFSLSSYFSSHNDVDDVAIKIKQFLKILLISSPKPLSTSIVFVVTVTKKKHSLLHYLSPYNIFYCIIHIYMLVMQNIDETSLWIIICRWLEYFLNFTSFFVSVVLIIMTSINDWMRCFWMGGNQLMFS